MYVGSLRKQIRIIISKYIVSVNVVVVLVVVVVVCCKCNSRVNVGIANEVKKIYFLDVRITRTVITRN